MEKNNVYTEFNVGDEVLITKSGEKGIIKSIQSYLGVGDNVYVVDVGNAERLYVESYMEGTGINVSVPEIETQEVDDVVLKEIDSKIDEIIAKLGLVQSDNREEILRNICKLQRFMAMRYEDDVPEKKIVNINSVVVNELYNALINGQCSYISNAYMFSEILARIGIKSLNIGCRDEDGEFYMTNLILVDDNYYYFDVSLEQKIFYEEVMFDEDFALCCAGLGKREYEEFFTPLCVLEYNDNITRNELPNNIAVESLSFDYLNSLIGINNG